MGIIWIWDGTRLLKGADWNVMQIVVENVTAGHRHSGVDSRKVQHIYLENVTPNQHHAEYIHPTVVTSPYGTVLHLPFDEGEGGVVNDLSRYGNDGVIYGADWTDGRFGKALDFDGASSYVSVADDVSLRITENITIAFWMKSNVFDGTWNGIIEKRPTGGQEYFVAINDINKLDFRWEGDGIASTKTFGAGDIGEWFRIVAVKDKSANQQRLYINGELDNEESSTVDCGGRVRDLYIGRTIMGAEVFDGILDDVYIFDGVHTGEEIKTRYDYEIHSHPLTLRGVVAYLKAGVPSDADFVNVVDAVMVIDSVNHRIWVRDGGVWRYAPLTTP